MPGVLYFYYTHMLIQMLNGDRHQDAFRSIHTNIHHTGHRHTLPSLGHLLTEATVLKCTGCFHCWGSVSVLPNCDYFPSCRICFLRIHNRLILHANAFLCLIFLGTCWHLNFDSALKISSQFVQVCQQFHHFKLNLYLEEDDLAPGGLETFSQHCCLQTGTLGTNLLQFASIQVSVHRVVYLCWLFHLLIRCSLFIDRTRSKHKLTI